MKKYFLVLLMVCCCFITGCFGNNKDDTLKEIKKKYDNLKAYQLTGNLEIVNNDDTYNYDVKVVYQKNLRSSEANVAAKEGIAISDYYFICKKGQWVDSTIEKILKERSLELNE